MYSRDSRRRRDSHILRVAERSNGLAFSHHHFLSLCCGSDSYAQSQTDVSAPVRPRENIAGTLNPVDEHPEKENPLPIQQKVRSLIPPIVPVRRTGPSTILRRLNLSSSNSIKSFTSSMQSWEGKEKMPLTATLAAMPLELLEGICQFVPQKGLHSLMLCNSNFGEVAAKYLYMEPEFASTYRFAQFTFIVVNRQHYAQIVRTLDISTFFNARDKEDPRELAEMAGWREFKYRHHQMFAVPEPHASCSLPTSSSPPYKSLEEQKALGLPFSRSNRTHPAPSPMLSSFHRCRDVPIGGIYHVLASCTRLKHINMSMLHLASDFIVISPSIPRPTNTSVKTPNFYISEPEQSKAAITFVSDVPKSWTWENAELEPIFADALLDLICKLRELETFKARYSFWLNTNRVRRLMWDAQRMEPGIKGLIEVDFLNGGMERRLPWAIKGSRAVVEAIVGDMGDMSRERTIS